MSFVGEIAVNPNTRIGGFKAGGLFIKVSVTVAIVPVRILSVVLNPGLHRVVHDPS